VPEVPAAQVVAEPAQRNTAPCLALAAKIIASRDPEAVLGVFPADHHISRPDLFLRYLDPAFEAAAAGRLVTLGIHPRKPETGYGYLEFPKGTKAGTRVVKLRRFREKPGLADAQRYIDAGNFYWNAGMFFWRAQTFLDCVARYLPNTAARIDSLPKCGSRTFAAKLADAYPQCDNISVDYGVMEPASKAKLVSGIATADFGWNDLGSWDAAHDVAVRDAHQNAARGASLFHGSEGCLVDAHGKLVVLVGVADLVVVDTPDALLVLHRSRAQDVGKIVKALEEGGRHDLL
jgi:mannose-1-phosphate guanylyltransferase